MNGEKVCELKCKYNLLGKCTRYGLCIAKDLFIEELEKIKAEILKKVWRDAQGQIVTRDGFNHGIITATDIIDKHISELKGSD